jgi:V/A-type H+-transporting ATPase subunit D
MGEIKLTKNELRGQQTKLHQLVRYLPTLQLKKALLQAEVHETRTQIEKLQEELDQKKERISSYASLLAQHLPIDISRFVRFQEIQKRYENIAGVDVPHFVSTTYLTPDYDLFDTPVWLESVIFDLRTLTELEAKIIVADERKKALEKEFREVSIRVNLFEKILIPRCEKNIKKIKIFLGDAQLAAVAQAKVAKVKIEEGKQEELHAH